MQKIFSHCFDYYPVNFELWTAEEVGDMMGRSF